MSLARSDRFDASAGVAGNFAPDELPQGVPLEEILANFSEALVVLDSDWRIVFVNNEAARLNQKSKEELLGRSHWDVWPAAIGTEIERQYRVAMERRTPVQLDYFYEGGHRAWLDIRAYPCGSGIAIYYRDITKQRNADTEVLRQAKEFKDLVENAAIAMHWVSEDGTILWANQAELQLLGYSREEYIRHNIAEFHLDAPVIRDILERLKNNEQLEGYEARLVCKDKSIRYVSINSNVYREDGRFIHTQCFTRDLTDTKAATDLRERMAAIVESSDDAIISKDLQGIIRSWNRGAQRIFGYTAAEAIGMPVSMLAVPGRQDEIPNIIERISRGERVDHYETRRKTKDGRELSISLTVSPIRDSSGAIVGASKVARDITERAIHEQALREANETLRRSNADLEHFAYSASHDLQEPLRMVATYSEMLRRKFAGQLGEAGDEYLGYAITGAVRMERLLKDLREYTRATTAEQPPAGDVNANEILAQVITNLQSAILESGASITHTELPTVRMHEFQLTQLLQNLIGNSLRYRSELPPQVQVAAERQGEEWVFSVRDNGIGIDPAYKEQVFGIFKRLHTASDYPGTGMGLAICQRIVQRTGGRIWVESELGRGATFFFTVPDRERR